MLPIIMPDFCICKKSITVSGDAFLPITEVNVYNLQ